MVLKHLIGEFRNLRKYMRMGGVVYTTVSTVNPHEQLLGKNILITGGTSGIGLAIARMFLSEGANVVITGRHLSKLTEVSQSINSQHLDILQWDVSEPGILEHKFIELDKLVSSIDIFINNAGVYDYAPLGQVTPEMFDKVIGTNERGLYFMCQAEATYFLNRKLKGKIINICSIAGLVPGMNPYSVSKWGATCITKGLAKQLASKGIIVNGIAPGNVVTNIHDGVRGKDIKDNAYMPDHLTQRYTLVEEVAGLALYLASDIANNVVGQVIAIDGGWTLK